MRILFTVLLLLGLSACSRYSFDINNNQVYTPPTVFTQFSMADKALQSCLDQVIKDSAITTQTSLKTLQCSYAGIESIEGISAFSRIEQLSLKGNKITNIEELLALTHLRYLDLSDNPITDCQTLDQLGAVVTETVIHNSDCQ